MPRSKEITLNEKPFVLKEKRVKELETLLGTLIKDFNKFSELKTADDLKSIVNVMLRKRLPEIIEGVTADDVDNAFPSEIEEAVEAFMEVNFTGLRGVLTKVFNLAHVVSR